ncbi:hypothetical protein BC332_13775 [Capsicum chinense]|nr:hypothetical protein BC332_13775 [Capsicum chinense]
MEAMHICFTILTASMSVEVERFLLQLIESSPRILTKSLIHLQLHMVNAITHSTSACNTHVMIEFLLIIVPDVPLDVIRPDKLFVFLVLKHLPRSHSDIEDFENQKLHDAMLLNRQPKITIEIESYSGPRTLSILIASSSWGIEIPAIASSLATFLISPYRLCSVSHACFEVEVLEIAEVIVGFQVEIEWIIRKITSGPTKIDVISIVGIPGLGETTLAYKVYNDKSIVGHFDVCAWCTIDQERNDKKLLQKIFNQIIGLKGRVSEDAIDNGIADKLWKQLFGNRKEKIEALWLEVLNSLSFFIFKDEEEVEKSFGDITSLKNILVWGSRRLIESALKIKEDVTENMAEDNLEVLYNAKESWDKLKEEFEGSNRFKSVKVLALKREFELLKIKDSDSVKEYSSMLMDIVNQIRILGGKFPDQKVVEKIMVSL